VAETRVRHFPEFSNREISYNPVRMGGPELCPGCQTGSRSKMSPLRSGKPKPKPDCIFLVIRFRFRSTVLRFSQAVSQVPRWRDLPSSGQGGGRYRWNRTDLGLPNLLTTHAHIATSCSYIIGEYTPFSKPHTPRSTAEH